MWVAFAVHLPTVLSLFFTQNSEVYFLQLRYLQICFIRIYTAWQNNLIEKLTSTEILEVNLFAFANKLTSWISVYKAPHWAFYHVWFQNKSELYEKLTSELCVYNALYRALHHLLFYNTSKVCFSVFICSSVSHGLSFRVHADTYFYVQSFVLLSHH